MDGASPVALAKLLYPKTPLIFKTTLLQTLHLSDTSSKWDLRTALTVTVLRSLLEPAKPSPVGKTQRLTKRDPGVKGRKWISRVGIRAPPEDDARQKLFAAVDAMKESEDETYTQPEYSEKLEVEWTGYRQNVADDAPEPSISEKEKYEEMMSEVSSDVTILYFHGGAYYLCDPASHRAITTKLARMTGGRVFSVRYRLAPQHAFPAQLLDGLVAYLSLIHPPADMPHAHAPVSASNIVFAGDSAGGNLSFALLQLLLQFHRMGTTTIHWQGKDVDVPLPGGVACMAPWMDITRSLPSLEENAKYDYLPPPSSSATTTIPPDDVWPTNPPRVDMFCDGSMMAHPLVSPLAAKDWSGAPPAFITCGEEMLADEDKFVAQKMARQGVKVRWLQFEGMPHCFAMLGKMLGTNECFNEWAGFCKEAVQAPEAIKTQGTWAKAKTLKMVDVDVEKLIELGDEDVLGKMREAQRKRVQGIEKEGTTNPAAKL